MPHPEIALAEAQRQAAEALIRQAKIHALPLADTFYADLAARLPGSRALFAAIGPERRQAKFRNMLSVFAHLRHLDRKIPALQAMALRHHGYGVLPTWYRHGQQALLAALDSHATTIGSTPVQRTAFAQVLAQVVALFEQSVDGCREQAHLTAAEPGIGEGFGDLLDAIGGPDVMLRVHQRFYDVIFDDPWLEQFFYGKNKPTLIRKQTEFMISCLDGQGLYEGETPAMIHMHMHITDEMFELRQQMLRDAILAEGLPAGIAERWLAVDGMFRQSVVKQHVSECVMKCQGQMPVTAAKPPGYRYTASVFGRKSALSPLPAEPAMKD